MVAIPLAGLLVSTGFEPGVYEVVVKSQSPWRVFWFPLKYILRIKDKYDISRNPLGGSFGFHNGFCV